MSIAAWRILHVSFPSANPPSVNSKIVAVPRPSPPANPLTSIASTHFWQPCPLELELRRSPPLSVQRFCLLPRPTEPRIGPQPFREARESRITRFTRHPTSGLEMSTSTVLRGTWSITRPSCNVSIQEASPWISVCVLRWRRSGLQASCASSSPTLAKRIASCLVLPLLPVTTCDLAPTTMRRKVGSTSRSRSYSSRDDLLFLAFQPRASCLSTRTNGDILWRIHLSIPSPLTAGETCYVPRRR